MQTKQMCTNVLPSVWDCPHLTGGAFKSWPWAVTLNTAVKNAPRCLFIAIYVDGALAALRTESIRPFLPALEWRQDLSGKQKSAFKHE